MGSSGIEPNWLSHLLYAILRQYQLYLITQRSKYLQIILKVTLPEAPHLYLYKLYQNQHDHNSQC